LRERTRRPAGAWQSGSGAHNCAPLRSVPAQDLVRGSTANTQSKYGHLQALASASFALIIAEDSTCAQRKEQLQEGSRQGLFSEQSQNQISILAIPTQKSELARLMVPRKHDSVTGRASGK